MNTTLIALAEPNRQRIVELLKTKPLSVNEVAFRLRLSQPQTSKHLKVLNEVGLINVSPVAQKRIYALNPKPFKELEDWLDSFHDTWNKKLDNLEQLIKKG